MDRAELFHGTNYKQVLKLQQKRAVRERPQLTWKLIAEKIRVQPSYLSRSFNDSSVHLNEDHLFEILELLRFDDFEKDYVLLLRARDLATSPARRAHVQSRIDAHAKSHFMRVNAMRKEATPEDTAFLMNPLLLLIYVSLGLKRYANSPALLERVFALSSKQLDEYLRQLEEMNLIKYDAKKRSVLEVRKNSIHFAKEHPLMRGHQQILRHLTSAHLARLGDHEKVSFMATFSASASAYEKIKEDFYKFLAEAQKTAGAGEGERVFQMGFDLFAWD